MILRRAPAVGVALLLLAPGCDDGADEPAAFATSPAPVPAPTVAPNAEPVDPPAPTSPEDRAVEEICSSGRRVTLYRLPDPFQSLVQPTGYEERRWKLGVVDCERIEVLGRTDPEEARVVPKQSNGPMCPYVQVRSLGPPRGEAWVNECLSAEVAAALPAIRVEPLHPEALPDLALGVRRSHREGETCVGPGAHLSGWDVVLENRGRGTSSPTVPLTYESILGGRTRRETFTLVRGMEPGESITIGYADDFSRVTFDLREEVPDADRTNNQVEVGSTPVLVCG